MKTAIKIGLIKGRHDIQGINDYIFEGDIKDVTDTQAMADTVAKKLESASSVDVFVTGLTVALIEVVNFAIFNNLPLTLWHFNRDTGNYFPQVVVSDAHKSQLVEGGYVAQ